MAKRRSCRRTAQEDMYHERAVKIRKMTDEQLCTYIDDKVKEAYEKGLAGNKQAGPAEEKPAVKTVGEFISAITVAKIPGIGAVTINKLLKVATENGYIEKP